MFNVRILSVTALLFGSCAIWPPNGDAGQTDKTARSGRTLPAVRATGPIRIDGALDEADWARAPVARGFIQNDPREGERATEDTDVRVLYDANNLYVGVFAHDREPFNILTSELAKDFNRESGDDFEMILDTFHDERNGYMFATNAHGAKWDAQTINEGREINENWDGLWDVKARITEAGWYAEIAIPFRTLRFSSADEQTWGINFQRRIRRRNEDSFWAPLPRIYDLQRVSLAGTLAGLQGVRPGNDIRLKPYVLGSAGESTATELGANGDVGLDVKYGVTSGLTWDFTVNTDFSQVEADEQQVNLTRFSLFFPEKRDFFLENSGIFQFGQGRPVQFGGGGGFTSGRQTEAILFFSRRIGLSENGASVPIVGGTRLTGRAGAYSVGVVNIQQRRSETSPASNFTALRLRRNVLANSDLGVIALNKDAPGGRHNRVAGADANFRFFENLDLNVAIARAFSPAAAIPGRGSESMGNAGVHYRDRRWELQATYFRIGERFNDEMGFVPRTGIAKFDSTYGARFRPARASKWLRELFPHLGVTNVSWLTGDLQSRLIGAHLSINLQDGSGGEVGVDPTTENLIVPFMINRRRRISIPTGRYEFNDWHATWRTNVSAPVSLNARVDVGDFYDGDKQSYGMGAAVRLRGRLNASINESRNQIRLRGGEYTTDLITARVEYGFSTIAFANALLQYNTDAREWSSNLRFNLIHHRLSDFFLVFNERRDSITGGLLDRALVAKMTYMVAF